LLPTPSATLKKNRTVDTPGEGLHNSTRMWGHMKLNNNTIMFSNVVYIWKTFEYSSTRYSLTYLILLTLSGRLSELPRLEEPTLQYIISEIAFVS
jgi:hypothetical protein